MFNCICYFITCKPCLYSTAHAKAANSTTVPPEGSSHFPPIPLKGLPSELVEPGGDAMLPRPLIIRSAKPEDVGADTASVTVPITTAVPPGANDTGLPDIIITGPPSMRVGVPMMKFY